MDELVLLLVVEACPGCGYGFLLADDFASNDSAKLLTKGGTRYRNTGRMAGKQAHIRPVLSSIRDQMPGSSFVSGIAVSEFLEWV